MTTDRTALEAARDALPPLLRCPFCNMEARWFTAGRDAHGIECSDGEDCPGRAQTNVYGTEHKHCAVDDWNTRGGMSPEDAAPQEAAPALDDARESDRQLMAFYSVESLHALIDAQERHIVKLQAKLPPLRDEFPRTPREG